MNPRAVAVLLVALAACGPAPRDAGPAATAPSHGGRFVYPMPVEPTTLNFVAGTELHARLVTRLVGDSLVDHGVDLRPVPRLARSWEFSPDGRVLTFHLRPDARFHDGVPVTSADVLYTYERAVDPESRAPGVMSKFLPIARVDTPNPLTVRVTYDRPFAPALLAWDVPILPRHLYAGGNFATSPHNRAPVGSGPFRFVSWEPGRRIVLRANGDWWGGRPHLDSVIFAIVPSQETTLRALEAGELDYAMLTPTQWDATTGRASFTRRFRPVTYPSLFHFYIALRGDGRNGYFVDPAVRRAFSLAIDRAGYVRTVLRGMGVPTDSLLQPGRDAAAEADAPRYDPGEAARLLDASGWTIDRSTGLRVREGRPFRFTLLIYSGSAEHFNIAQVVQEMMRRLGITMLIERLDWPGLWSRLRSGAFEAALSGMLPESDPDWVYGQLHSSEIDGGQNYAAIRDRQIDAWLEAARHTLDPAARRDLYARIDARVRQLMPYAPLYRPIIRGALARRIHGLEPSPLGLLDPFPGLAKASSGATGP